MALIWADGFGTYGNTGRMRTSGAYVYTTNSGDQPLQIGSGANARTGNYYWFAREMSYQNWQGGHMIGGARSILGAGAAFLFPTPPSRDGFCLFKFTGGNKDQHQCAVTIHPDGSLRVVQYDNGTTLGVTAPGIIVPGAYSYVEMRVFCDSVNGTVEVRRNNQVVLLITGVNTNVQGTGNLTGVMHGQNNWAGGGYGVCEGIADLVIWDATGTYNNDFMGDVRCRTFFPVADGPEQDWTPTGAATNWEAVDAVPYNDAIYSAGANVGDKVNFSKAALPVNTAYVAGVQLFTSMNKTDSGTCEVLPQIVGSDGTVASGAPISPGTGTAQFFSQFDVDPTTGATFTRLDFDSALFQLERTA
jgi:hypothetical protein